MRQERWKIVRRLIEQIEGTTGPLVMAVAPAPLDVVLYETPALVKSQPPRNPLRGFIQEAILLLKQPTAAQIASLLHLPCAIVELVLGSLQQMGGAVRDTAGRWSVPDRPPQFRTGGPDPPIWRRARTLLCYWPKQQMLLPVLPRMRLRDLVELGVHNLRGEVADWYSRIAAWPDYERLKRGGSRAVRLLPLRPATIPPGSEFSATSASPDTPLLMDEVLVSRCRLDVIALTWVHKNKNDGVWEVTSRLWSRPTPARHSEGEPFAPGEPVMGLPFLEQLLGSGATLDDLGKLFSPNPEAWRTLLDNREAIPGLRRELNDELPALIVAEQVGSAENRHWQGLRTRFARDARLICWAGERE